MANNIKGTLRGLRVQLTWRKGVMDRAIVALHHCGLTNRVIAKRVKIGKKNGPAVIGRILREQGIAAD